MKISDFELYRDLLQRYSGLSLTAERSYLLDSRLTPVARKWGYPTLDSMTLALRGVPETKLIEDVIEAMMTQDTQFFRDMKPFFALKNVMVPHFIKTRGRNRDLRIWSAGCSTGQEPFSIAMALKEIESTMKNWRIQILGTDLSTNALTRAGTGHYSQFEIQRGLPVKDLVRHFDETDDGWTLHSDIRNMVHFEPFNILENMDDLGLFDIIFCRNVLTYFDAPKRASILSRMADQLADDGFLVLGIDENLNGLDTPFEMLDAETGIAGFSDTQYNLETSKKTASS
jgi:chemotaxis protein methyltransferase CheR